MIEQRPQAPTQNVMVRRQIAQDFDRDNIHEFVMNDSEDLLNKKMQKCWILVGSLHF